MTAAPDVTVSALPRSDVEESARAVTGRIVERSAAPSPEADADRPPYLPALDVLRPGLLGSEKTWLRFFHSFVCDAEVASRSFCGRCGAQVAFHCRPQAEWFGPLFKQPDGFSDVMDICLGTVDRHLLDRDDWFAIEHDICWKDALGWYRKTLCQGRGEEARQHPSGSLGEVLDRDELLTDPKEWTRFELA
ncbi:hypothetical protein QQX98_005718 [Neonectria punicea]|uniref:Uncharacterized protein n=1 Tax=Neonectria punicea TaxID=979145 RepID=A0ABR1H443_9HYPO